MSISKLLNNYDLYCEFRLRAFKALYICITVFLCNVLFTIYDPTINFALMAVFIVLTEAGLIGAKDKIVGVFVFGTVSLLIMLAFNFTYPHPTLYTITVLVGVFVVYCLNIAKYPYLSGRESLIIVFGFLSAENANHWNLYVSFNQLISGYCAVFLTCLLVIIFPSRWYYYRLWLRAFHLSMLSIHDDLLKQEVVNEKNNHKRFVNLHKHLIKMDQFTKMIGKQDYNFSMTKINLSVCKLSGYMVVFDNIDVHTHKERRRTIVLVLNQFLKAVINEKPFDYNEIIVNIPQINEIFNGHEGNKDINSVDINFINIFNSWNMLCSLI